MHSVLEGGVIDAPDSYCNILTVGLDVLWTLLLWPQKSVKYCE